MTDRAEIKAELRTGIGSKQAEALRREGKLPAIIYGHKEDAVAVTFDEHEFVECLHHGHRLFDIKIGSKNETLLVKDLQYGPFGRQVIHADMVRVDLKERVEVSVPLVLKGTAKGTQEGGIIDQVLGHLEVECLVTGIPESITVSIKEIVVGGSIHAGEIKLPDGVTLVTGAEMLVLTCHMVAAAKSTEELEAEMPTAPEVIGAEGGEGEGEEEAS